MRRPNQYVLCLKNRGYRASLEIRKVYRALEDAAAEKHGYVRVIDESGEDYLYPASWFVAIALPRSAVRAFSRKSA